MNLLHTLPSNLMWSCQLRFRSGQLGRQSTMTHRRMSMNLQHIRPSKMMWSCRLRFRSVQLHTQSMMKHRRTKMTLQHRQSTKRRRLPSTTLQHIRPSKLMWSCQLRFRSGQLGKQSMQPPPSSSQYRTLGAPRINCTHQLKTG